MHIYAGYYVSTRRRRARARILRLKGARAARYNFTPGISKRRVRAKCTLRPRFMGRRRNRKGFEAWRNYYIADAYIRIYASVIKRESSFDARIRENRKYSFFPRMDKNDCLMAIKEKVSIATLESPSTMSKKEKNKIFKERKRCSFVLARLEYRHFIETMFRGESNGA